MNEAENKVKQQIVEKIKGSNNILVAVSKNPSVDELSAAIGLTALLNKQDKHATAIFSGVLPPAITFLEPDKVFKNSADSLRDFIIALDKEKADHLRYRVEGDVVKIFITPYRTTITGDDLTFSQGDYNIELVLALGVVNQDYLDAALDAHGQILTNITVATFSAGEQASQLGSMDWRDENASSLSEMVVSISELLMTDKSLLDKQIATALLTGIVSSTDRFSNPRTSSKVMTMAAQLMAAGADQQLIAAKLRETHEINALPSIARNENPTGVIFVDIPSKPAAPAVDNQIPTPVENNSSLIVSHEIKNDAVNIEPIAPLSEPVLKVEAPIISPQPVAQPVFSFVPSTQSVTGVKSEMIEEPLLGGTLSATSEQAAEDAKRGLDDQQNKTILEHSYLEGSGQAEENAINSIGQTEETRNIDIFSDAPMSTLPPKVNVVDLPMPPPLPDFSTLPPSSDLLDLSVPYSEPAVSSTLQPASDISATKNDPTQFQIPGQ